MATAVLFLVAPPEKVVQTLTENSKYHLDVEREGDKWKAYRKGSWRATIEPYKFAEKRVETQQGEIEKGTLGSKMEWNRSNGYVKDAVSDYAI